MQRDDELLPRLPLPLAQLYRRACNAKTPLERHLTVFYLWEAGLKLLASVAIVEYAEQPNHDPSIAERLQNLARPSLGHWWEFVRLLVPALADSGDEPFAKVRELVLGRSRDDLPRSAGLDAFLRERLEGKAGARTTVCLTELFDRLVTYRNKVVGHGAPGQLKDDFNHRAAEALLGGLNEIYARLDVLAGRRLIYVSEVRQVGGQWLIQQQELAADGPRRIPSLELPRTAAGGLPDAERLHLQRRAGPDAAPGQGNLSPLVSLHPLVVYQPDSDETLFLNARSGKKKTEFLCYTSGKTEMRADLGSEQRALLGRVLKMEISPTEAEAWAADSFAGEEPQESPISASPRRIGEYELLSELGRGGMGIVYRAWQPSTRRQVALKRLINLGDKKTEQRFAREIRALGRVEHPNLVKIFTSGNDGEHSFYVMELVEGAPLSALCDRLSKDSTSAAEIDAQTWRKTLSTVCEDERRKEQPISGSSAGVAAKKTPLPPEDGGPAQAGPGEGASRSTSEAKSRPIPLAPTRAYVTAVAELIQQAAEAAHVLHEAGIIHRDIKPGNIIVTPDGSQAVLMDLGLAQLADDEEGRLTRTRQFVGTLRYASPQQVLATVQLDRRADVYSLGVTLWELLTLRPLFGATDQTPTPVLMEKIQLDEPDSIRKYHPGISKDLEAIVQKCLHKKADDRYATAHDLAAELRRFLNSEPVLARPATRLERGLRWAMRHQAVAATYLLTIVAIFLTLVGSALVYLYRDAANARRVAEQAKVVAEQALEGERKAKAGELAARDEAAEVIARQRYIDSVRTIPALWKLQQFSEARRLHGNCPDKYRNFEWHYLDRVIHPELATLAGHTEYVEHVAFSPDGQRLASASRDSTVKLWEVASGQLLATLAGHTSFVIHVAFSPDGQRLASASDDKTVKLWEVASGKELATLAGHTESVNHVAFSADGQRLASASYDRTVKLWEGVSGKVLATLAGHTDTVNHVAFSPDGQRLASASVDNTVKLWEVTSGKELATLAGHTSSVNNVAFSPDGHRLASASLDGTVKLWEVASGKVLATLAGHTDHVRHVAFSPDGQRLASASDDKTVKLWAVVSGQELATLTGHTSFVNQVEFSPDGQRVASASGDSTVKLWEGTGGQELATLAGHTDSILHVALSPDGQRLASASDDRTVKLWEVASAKELATLEGHTRSVNHVAFSPDSQRLASAGRDKTIRLWEVASGQELATLAGHTESVWRVAFSPDGQRLASASLSTVKLWEVASGQELATLAGHTGLVNQVAFSPDGQRLASASGDNTVKFWEVASGQELATLAGHTDSVQHVAFSPDGQRLASASHDHTVRLWEVASGRVLATLAGHTDFVWYAAFSPDSQRLASASRDKTVKLWEVASGQELATLAGHTDYVSHVAFSPDSQRLASASRDKTVKLWEVASGQELATLAGHSGSVMHPYSVLHVAFSPDGQHLASASSHNAVKLWIARETDEERERRRLAWPEIQLLAAEWNGEWFAAVFFLNQLLKRSPQDASLLARRGNANAQLQRWPAAIADYQKACDQNPAKSVYWHELGLAHLAAGDHPGYRQVANAMLERFAETDNGETADWTAYLGAMLPDSVADFRPLVKLARFACSQQPENVGYLETLAAILYRAGNLTEAESTLRLGLEKVVDHRAAVWMQLFLAMTCHRLDQPKQAQEWLGRAVVQIEEYDQEIQWQLKVQNRILRQEAEALLKSSPQQSSPPKEPEKAESPP